MRKLVRGGATPPVAARARTAASLALAVIACTASASAQWSERVTVRKPSSRWAHAMSYDWQSGRILLFGGSGMSDTWEWDGAAWRQRPSVQYPAGRGGHAMTYDTQRQRTVMFGGCCIGGVSSRQFGDTWELDASGWRQRYPETSPSARQWHTMAYDSLRGRVVLFGGESNVNSPTSMLYCLGDTWEWDGNNWMQRASPVSPAWRRWHAMAYDSSRARVVLFGGKAANNHDLADTWEWDGFTWRQCRPALHPSARSGHAMAYDPTRAKVVLYAGDTWEWNGEVWEQRQSAAAPPTRSWHSMAFDPARGRVVLFGGLWGDTLSDTWEADWSNQFLAEQGQPVDGSTPAGDVAARESEGDKPVAAEANFARYPAIVLSLQGPTLGVLPGDSAASRIGLHQALLFGSSYYTLFTGDQEDEGFNGMEAVLVPMRPAIAGLRLHMQAWSPTAGPAIIQPIASNAVDLTTGSF